MLKLRDNEQITPYFQPIISSETHDVYAYEVLGRIVSDDGVRSLGSFFESPSVPDHEKFCVDTLILERALEQYVASGSKAKLFVNTKPSWIINGAKNTCELPILRYALKYGVSPSNIVIEVTEDELADDIDSFSKLLSRYRKAGCWLAIDDFGKSSSNFERVAYVSPDIVKIDKAIIDRIDYQRSFLEICQAMHSFGSQVGFALLFEGVETIGQLECCAKAGGELYQGFIFSKAKADLNGQYENKKIFSNILNFQYTRTMRAVNHKTEITKEMDAIIDRNPKWLSLKPLQHDSKALYNIAGSLPYYCLNCYICDHSGKQLSCVYTMRHGGIEKQQDRRHDLFKLRFFPDIAYALESGLKSYISTPYKDIKTKEDIVTYVRVIADDVLLCVNIMGNQAV